MWKSDPALDKYWLSKSGYFRLVATVALGMGIANENILVCNSNSEESRDNNVSLKE